MDAIINQVGRFTIIVTPGRAQPYALWRDKRIWQFCATEAEAIAYANRAAR